MSQWTARVSSSWLSCSYEHLGARRLPIGCLMRWWTFPSKDVLHVLNFGPFCYFQVKWPGTCLGVTIIHLCANVEQSAYRKHFTVSEQLLSSMRNAHWLQYISHKLRIINSYTVLSAECGATKTYVWFEQQCRVLNYCPINSTKTIQFVFRNYVSLLAECECGWWCFPSCSVSRFSNIYSFSVLSAECGATKTL